MDTQKPNRHGEATQRLEMTESYAHPYGRVTKGKELFPQPGNWDHTVGPTTKAGGRTRGRVKPDSRR